MEGGQLVVCIPAHNEEKSIAKVVISAKKVADLVLVCDDGSTDMTAEIATSLGVRVIKNESNHGKGSALQSLMIAAKAMNPSAVVTIDADDQHDPRDITKVAEPILKGDADVVVGVRPTGEMPRDRAFGNKVLDTLTSTAARQSLHDSQSGFRAYSFDAINKIDFTEKGMATESQTLIEAARLGLRITEVPISVRYQGIPQKRSRVAHLSEVTDYVITRTIIESPLLYLGIPSLVAVLVGVVAGVQVVNISLTTHHIATGTALVATILVIGGIVLGSTSLILKLMTVRMRG